MMMMMMMMMTKMMMIPVIMMIITIEKTMRQLSILSSDVHIRIIRIQH